MYDNFEPLNEIKMFPFQFKSSNYKIWENGNVIKEGNHIETIKANPVNYGKEQMNVTLHNSEVTKYLKSEVLFDKFITSVDRLQLLIIPADPPNDNQGIAIFKNYFGSTRVYKSFNTNEPYCCNIFFINQTIVRITFSFSKTVRLIEFNK